MFSCKIEHFRISTSTRNLNWSSQKECLVLATVRRFVVNNVEDNNVEIRWGKRIFKAVKFLTKLDLKNVSSFEFVPQFMKPGCLKLADHYSNYLNLVKFEPMGNKIIHLILNTIFQHTLMKPRQLCKVDICAQSFEWKFTYMKD